MEDQGENESYESGTQRSGLEIRICESSSQGENIVLSVTLEFIGNERSISIFRKIKKIFQVNKKIWYTGILC